MGLGKSLKGLVHQLNLGPRLPARFGGGDGNDENGGLGAELLADHDDGLERVSDLFGRMIAFAPRYIIGGEDDEGSIGMRFENSVGIDRDIGHFASTETAVETWIRSEIVVKRIPHANAGTSGEENRSFLCGSRIEPFEGCDIFLPFGGLLAEGAERIVREKRENKEEEGGNELLQHG